METINYIDRPVSDCGINCTLRNGNAFPQQLVNIWSNVLIVPCGMET